MFSSQKRNVRGSRRGKKSSGKKKVEKILSKSTRKEQSGRKSKSS